MSEQYAVIVAGGSGTRMQSDIPKQFLPLHGKPVLMHTIQAFRRYSTSLSIIVVLPAAQQTYWQQLCQQHNFNISHHLVAGGATRTASVWNGLKTITAAQGLVAVHDGVRPMVSVSLIARAFQTAQQTGNAVASVPLKDSIRQLQSDDNSAAVDREHYRLVQTPQTFQLPLIRRAYEAIVPGEMATDDAVLIERIGEKVCLIEGDYQNIKITTQEDLSISEALLRKTSERQ